MADEHLLRQLLMNLMDNALAHTPSGGTITVSLSRAGRSVVLAVADTGSGVGAADVYRIFDRFVRVGCRPGNK